MSPQPTLKVEQHQIFDRVTRVETQVSALADTVYDLAKVVTSTNESLGEIKTLISSVGKTDGRTIITLGAALLGATVMVGSIFLGPIQRDVSYLDGRLREVAQQKAEVRFAEYQGETKLMDWRLKALEEKR